MASFFLQQSPNLGSGGRSGRSRKLRTAAQFYADNKQMLEATRAALFSGNSTVPVSHDVKRKPVRPGRSVVDFKSRATFEAEIPQGEDPELTQLRKEFQYQQDRLLAWGVFWSELGAKRAQQEQTKAHSQATSNPTTPADAAGNVRDGDVKVEDEHSAMGDLVASIIGEIKKLLDQSGRLSHPGRYESAMKLDIGLGNHAEDEHPLTRQQSAFSSGPNSPQMDRKENPLHDREWQMHEIQNGKVVLEQLTNCIDILYSLVDPSESDQAAPTSKSKKRDDMLANEDAHTALMQTVHSHPLYIDFPLLQPMHDPNIDGDLSDSALPPPSYDDAQHHLNLQARSIYFYAEAQAHVLVDLVATNLSNLPTLLLPSSDEDGSSPIYKLHELAENLSGRGLLSWDGHMKLLGFTLAGSRTNARFGLVYALPAPSDPTALQSYQTLASSLVMGNGSDHEASIPPLENKFRLAYNIAMLATEYLAHGSIHGFIRSNNMIFLRESENPHDLGSSIRSPYILQPVQALAGQSSPNEPLNEVIYHHPDADAFGYGGLAAHDIYSVGLLLLELGMWVPLRRFWKPKYEHDRHMFVDRLQRTYAPKLASKCGTRYMKVVQKCLAAPLALEQKPSVIDATEYAIEILKELAQCCALDEDGPPNPLDIEVFEAMLAESRATQPPEDADTDLHRKFEDKVLPPLPSANVNQAKAKLPKRRGAGRTKSDQPSLHKYPDLPIPQPKLNTWNTCLLPKLQKVLTDVLSDSPDAASVNLMMIGPSPEKAMTTIVIQCSDTGRVHEELKTRLKGRLRLGRGWGLVIVKGDVRRSGKHRRGHTARRAGASSSGRSEGELKTIQQEYQSLPSTGASIGAFKDGYHLPPVSFGGTVLLDGKPFGMSVHHMLDDVSERGSEDDSESDADDQYNNQHDLKSLMPQRSSAKADTTRMELDSMGMHMGANAYPVTEELDISDDEGFGEDFQMYDSDSDTSTIRPDYSMFDDEGNEYWFMEDGDSLPELEDDEHSEGSSSNESDLESIGDKPGYHPDMSDYDDEELCVTQPALDDVEEDFFPSMEDRDDDHLASHSLGFLYASSGIRRKVYQNAKHEIDWALIKINKDRCGFTHRNSRSKTQSLEHSQPHLTRIAPLSSLPNTKVHCIGRSSGAASGRISPAMSLIKFHGRNSFSSSYTIEGGFGIPGDSGAWVWNAEKNELCGHVLAWADGLKVAFLGPMEVIFEDIKDRLGCDRIELVTEVMERERIVRERRLLARQHSQTDRSKPHSHTAEPPRMSVNEQLERAKELQFALKRMSLHSTNDSRATSPTVRSRDNSGDTLLSKASRGSSASSNYAVSDTEGRNDSAPRARKDQFDMRNNVMHMPMARASS